MIRIRG